MFTSHICRNGLLMIALLCAANSAGVARAADCNTNGTDDLTEVIGTVVFDQLGILTDPSAGNFVSDDASTSFAGATLRVTADDFSTAAANTVINRVNIRGFATSANKFIVKIWSNNPTGFLPPPTGVVGCSSAGDPGDGSLFPDNPGAVIYSEVVPSARVIASVAPGEPAPTRNFEIHLSANVTLAAVGRYWLEVYYNDPADQASWGWLASADITSPGVGSNMRRSHTCPTGPGACGVAEVWSRANNFNGRFDLRVGAIDRNANSVPDVCDDCNTNGLADQTEAYADCNSNFNPDACDGADCNTNAIMDLCEPGDCDADGSLDVCEIAAAPLKDRNTNGQLDRCELAGDWCLKGDMNLSRTVTAADIPAFVNALLFDTLVPAQRCAADANLDDRIDGDDIPGFVDAINAPDIDGDGVPDMYETNDGLALSPIQTGTDPFDNDSDNDGLSDGDECYPTVALLELHALGASPVLKDLFIEADWFEDATDAALHSHRPSAGAVAAITAAFADSPVTNPYGAAPGVRMHIDFGQGAPFTGGNLIPGGDSVVLFDSEFNTYKAAHFAANRAGRFHYAIFCHRYNLATNNSSGVAEIAGDDFIVSLQTFLDDSSVSKTIMHELGHNLNLRHGGFEDRNYKPNYNSVMNYRYQFAGIDVTCNAIGDGNLDYSIGTRISLNESSLTESAGVCGSIAVDWNASGTITSGLARNINCIAQVSTACGAAPNTNCGDTACQSYTDYNDWANILLFAGTQGDRPIAYEIIECDPTPEQVLTPADR